MVGSRARLSSLTCDQTHPQSNPNPYCRLRTRLTPTQSNPNPYRRTLRLATGVKGLQAFQYRAPRQLGHRDVHTVTDAGIFKLDITNIRVALDNQAIAEMPMVPPGEWMRRKRADVGLRVEG